jgi:ABC-2 type transport system permease protein
MLLFSQYFIDRISSLQSSNFVFSFSSIIYNYFFYFVFLIPALTMRTFAEERKSGTEILLMTTPLNNFQIVIGKFLGCATIYLLMLVLSLIFPIVTLIYGKVYWSSLFSAYIAFFLWGLVCIAIGLLTSAFTNNPVIAAIIGEMAMLLFLFLDQISTSAKYLNMPVVSDALKFFSSQERFKLFAQGVFALSDLVYYVSMTILVLGWTVILLERRKWKR